MSLLSPALLYYRTDDSRMQGTAISRTIWTLEINMTSAALKDARVELKTSGDTKDLLAKAAAMSGLDMTAFVLSAAVERARNVIADHAAIRLSLEGQRRFAQLLADPPKGPTEAMKKLAELPDLPERRR